TRGCNHTPSTPVGIGSGNQAGGAASPVMSGEGTRSSCTARRVIQSSSDTQTSAPNSTISPLRYVQNISTIIVATEPYTRLYEARLSRYHVNSRFASSHAPPPRNAATQIASQRTRWRGMKRYRNAKIATLRLSGMITLPSEIHDARWKKNRKSSIAKMKVVASEAS